MSDPFVPPAGHSMPATFRLTREYLALMRPGRDPDRMSDQELCEILGAEEWDDWLARYPDKELVERYWREDEIACAQMAADMALELAQSRGVETVILDNGEGRQTIIRRKT
jgi:hypothetical protein